MSAQRLTHRDLEPTFQGAGSTEFCGFDESEFGMFDDVELDIVAWEETRRDWSTLGLTFVAGLVAGGLLAAYRRPILGAINGGTSSAMKLMGLGATRTHGPHAPFDPRTKDLNSGVGAMSEQSYRTTEEAGENSRVTEASEESFPASDAPAWTGMSSGTSC